MNYAEAAFIVSLLTTGAWLAKALWNVWNEKKTQAKQDGKFQGLTIYNAAQYKEFLDKLEVAVKRLDERSIKDVQDIYEAMSKNNELANNRYHEFYREFSDFRFQVARYMKNGGSH